MIQYVQSRGRARSSVSKVQYICLWIPYDAAKWVQYIHMLESGNRGHLEMLNEVRNSEVDISGQSRNCRPS